jgi:hypothetical protein
MSTYTPLAISYFRILKRYSPAAAQDIRNIHCRYGAQAAYYAALALLLLKARIERIGVVPEDDLEADILEDYPDAVPMIAHAVESLTEDMRAGVYLD